MASGSAKQRTYSSTASGANTSGLPAQRRRASRTHPAGSAPIMVSGRPSGWARNSQCQVAMASSRSIRCHITAVGTMSMTASLVTTAGWSRAMR
jgi:hypothetical protein